MKTTQALLLTCALAGPVFGTDAAANVDWNFNGNRCSVPYFDAGAGMYIDPTTGIGIGELPGKAAYGTPDNELAANAPYFDAGAGMFIDPATGAGIGEVGELTGKAAYGMPGNELAANAPYFDAGAGMLIDPATGTGIVGCVAD